MILQPIVAGLETRRRNDLNLEVVFEVRRGAHSDVIRQGSGIPVHWQHQRESRPIECIVYGYFMSAIRSDRVSPRLDALG